MIRHLLFLLIAGCFVSGCGLSEEQEREEIIRITKRMEQWYKKADWDNLTAVFRDSATIYGPAAYQITDIESITEWWKRYTFPISLQITNQEWITNPFDVPIRNTELSGFYDLPGEMAHQIADINHRFMYSIWQIRYEREDGIIHEEKRRTLIQWSKDIDNVWKITNLLTD